MTAKMTEDVTEENKKTRKFPSLIWFAILGILPWLFVFIKRQMNKIDKQG
jgi:hypothetical protein